MADYYSNLPGGCFVNDFAISCEKITSAKATVEESVAGKITLNPELATAFGFSQEQPATLLVTQGQIIITTDANKRNILKAIQELQFRQDETKQDFTAALNCLLNMFR